MDKKALLYISNFKNQSKLVLLLFFIIQIVTYLSASKTINHFHIASVLIMMLISTFLFFRVHKIIFGSINWISPSALFIIGFIIVHFQMFIYLLFGLDLISHLFEFVWASEEVINKSASISLAGLLAFQIGFISFNQDSAKKKLEKSTIIAFYKQKNNSIFLIILAYLFYIAFFAIDSSYRGGDYNLSSGIGKFIFLLFNVFLISSISSRLLRINDENHITLIRYLYQLGTPILVLTSWHILFSLFIGDRGPIISYGLLLLGLYFFKFKKIRLYQLILIILIGATFLTILGKARRVSKDTNAISQLSSASSDNSLSNRFESDVPLEQTVELALSIRCLNHSIDKVPDQYGYHYGFFQLKQIVSIIPKGSSLMLKAFNKDEIYDGSSMYISFLIQGKNIKYGDGTTAVADLYLDFGIWGVILGLFLFGIFFRRGETAIKKGTNSLLLWVAITVYFSLSIYTGRSTLLFPLQTIFLSYIVLYLNYSITTALNSLDDNQYKITTEEKV